MSDIFGDETLFIQEFQTECKLLKLLGEGGNGKVFYGEAQPWIKKQDNPVILAIKCIRVNRKQSAQIVCNLQRLKELSDEHLIRYYSFQERPARTTFELDHILLVMEYCAGGTLETLLNKGRISQRDVVVYSTQLLKGISFLHKQQIIHTDLKPGNILFKEPEDSLVKTLKIADYDSPILLKEENTNSKDVPDCRGSGSYVSPEMAAKLRALKKAYTVGRKTDIWSFGCIVLDMHLGFGNRRLKQPGRDGEILQTGTPHPFTTIIQFINSGGMPLIPLALKKDARRFLSHCFEVNPDMRKNAEELLGDSFLFPLSEFGARPITPEEWTSWFSGSETIQCCPVILYPDHVMIAVGIQARTYCDMDAMAVEQKKICERIKAKSINRPLMLVLNGNLNWLEIMKPVTEQVVVLELHACHGWTSAEFKNLHLPNLVQISFVLSEEISFYNGHLSKFPNLRVISFHDSSVKHLEENFLQEIPNLQHFGLYHRVMPCFHNTSLPQIKNNELFRSANFSWLKNYLHENENLINSKMNGEVWAFGVCGNGLLMEEEIRLLPNWSNVKRDRESLPHFKMERFDVMEIKSSILAKFSDNHVEKQYSLNSGFQLIFANHIVNFQLDIFQSWVIIIDRKSTHCPVHDVEEFLKFIISLNKNHPISIRINLNGATFTTELTNALGCIHDHIIGLHLDGTSTSEFSQSELKRLKIPNLLELRISNFVNVSLKRGDLDGFPRLRAIIVTNSPVTTFEKNILGQLSDLRHFELTYGLLLPQDRLRQLVNNFVRKENQWMIAYFRNHAQLVESKPPGEIFDFSNNGYYYRSDGFILDEAYRKYLTS